MPTEDTTVMRRGWGSVLRAAAVGTLAVALTVVVTLQTNWATRLLLTRIVRAVTQVEDAAVTASAIRGNRLTVLELTDLRVQLGAWGEVATVDSLKLRYRLLPLLRSAVVVEQARVVGATLDVRDCALGWVDERTAADTAGSGWSIEVRRLAIEGGAAAGGDCDEGPWSVEDVDIEATALGTSPSPGVRVDALRMRIRPASVAHDYRADLWFVGSLQEGAVHVDSLVVRSPDSDVTASGVLRRLTAPSHAPDIDFTLAARPLALRDLQPFGDVLAPEGVVRIDVDLTGSDDVLDVDGEVVIDDGGAMSVHASLSETDGAYLRYRGEASVVDFDLSELLSGAPEGAVDGNVRFDVAGAKVDQLSGTANVELRRASAATDANHVEAEAVLADGRAEVSGQAQTGEMFAAFEGWIRPFSAPREGELSGDFQWTATGPSGLRTELSGAYGVALAFQELGRPTGRVEVDLYPSSHVRAAIADGTLELDLVDGVGTWRISAEVDEGRVDASGGVDISRDVPEMRVDEADVRDLDLNALLDAPSSTVVSGTLAGTRRGGAAGLGDWDATLVLRPSQVAALYIDSAFVDLALDDERLRADVRGGGAVGAVDAHLEGDLTDDGVFAISLAESRIRRMLVDSGKVELRRRADALDIDARLFPARGTLHVSGGRDVRLDETRWHVDEAIFEDLDVGALLDAGGDELRLSGRLDGSWSGASPATASGDLRVALGASAIGGWSLDTATVEASIEEGRSTWVASVESEDVAGDLDVGLDFLDGPPRARGTGRFHGRVRGVTIDSAFTAVRYQAGELRADTLSVWSPDIAAQGRAVALVRPPPRRIVSASLTAAVADHAPLASWFGLDVDDLERAELTAVATQVGDSLDVVADLTAVGVTYRSVGVTSASGSGRAMIAPGGSLSRLTASADLGPLIAAGVRIERVQLEATPDDNGTALTLDALVDSTRNANTSVLLLRQDDTTAIRLRTLRANVGAQRWTLDGVPTVRVSEAVEVHDFRLVSQSGRIMADGVVSRSGDQRLQVDVDGLELSGVSDILGYQDLRGVMGGSLLLAGTAESPRVDGSLSARGTLRGSAPAILDAEIHYDRGTLDLDAGLELGGVPAARVSGRLPLELRLAQAEGTGRRSGGIDRPLDLEVDAERLGLEWFAPWLPPGATRDLDGTLGARLRVTGTIDDPVPEGSLVVEGASAFVNPLGIELSDGAVVGRFVDDRFVIDLAEVYSGGGSLSATGTILASGPRAGELELQLGLDDFLAVRTELGRAVIDGELTVSGTTAEPSIAGRIDVVSADVYLGGRFSDGRGEAVELTAEDLAMLEERFGYVPPAALLTTREGGAGSVALDIDVALGRRIWVRRRANPALSVQLSGDLRVEKAHDELERVYGRLEAVPQRSFVEQFGRRFHITNGTVDFNGPPQELSFDVTGRYEVPTRGDPTASEVLIDLGVLGGLNDVRLVLSSEPEMENADIVSYLATGRPASETLQFDANGNRPLVEGGATMALGAATSAFERFASESVGLDVVQVRSDGLRGATVVAGRYVSPRLYLGFKQPIGFRRNDESPGTRTRSPEVEIEYEAFRWLLLNLQRDGSRIDFFLRSRYAY